MVTDQRTPKRPGVGPRASTKVIPKGYFIVIKMIHLAFKKDSSAHPRREKHVNKLVFEELFGPEFMKRAIKESNMFYSFIISNCLPTRIIETKATTAEDI